MRHHLSSYKGLDIYSEETTNHGRTVHKISWEEAHIGTVWATDSGWVGISKDRDRTEGPSLESVALEMVAYYLSKPMSAEEVAEFESVAERGREAEAFYRARQPK